MYRFTSRDSRICYAQDPHAEGREFQAQPMKAMTYRIDTCRYRVLHSALVEWDNEWLPQCKDNVTEWDIGSWLLAVWSVSCEALYNRHECTLLSR